ncbi:MAG: hypothetical protein QG655_1842 [Actinomycetota bacterium]|jgi:hypothetical protein|nr:hypothetical protein [Actinomycetota bacterium]
MGKRKNRAAVADPALSTPPSDSSDHNERTDEFKLDRLLVGDKSIWAALFDGEFKLAVPCSRCGRWLTSGASKRHRMGSHCAAKAVKK